MAAATTSEVARDGKTASEAPGESTGVAHYYQQRLSGKVAIVTGSSSGIGRAIAIAYAKGGAKVICADIRPEARPHLKQEVLINTDALIVNEGGHAFFVKTDVTSEYDVQQLVTQTVAQHGRVDILVNNAGISLEAGQPPRKIHETTLETWDKTIAVNQTSIFLLCKHVLAQMMRQKPSANGDRGWIINMASIYGLVGGKAVPSYCASKGAVVNLTKQIAVDYAEDGIRCNTICPGYTRTAIFEETVKFADRQEIAAKHPLLGLGSPNDIVGAAIFLASPESRWITGAALPVDGGYTAQ